MDANVERTRETDTRHQRGQGTVEYGVILMLVALLLILTVALIGHQTSNLFSNVSNALPSH